MVTLGGSVGAFIAWAVRQIGITIGRIAAKISELLAKLGDLLGKLGKLGGHLGDLANNASRYANVRAVQVDDFASAPGRWVTSGGPQHWGEVGQSRHDAFERANEVVRPTEVRLVDDSFNWNPHINPDPPGDSFKASAEAAKGTEKADDDYEHQRQQAEENFGD